jgi:hypothetical protein
MKSSGFREKANRAWDAAITLWKLMQKSEKLHQKIAVKAIRGQHGEEFIYQNRHANPAIHRYVLCIFEMFTEGKIVWAKHGHYWRWRRSDDPVNRREVFY